jgi:hypothetical protein
MGAIIIKANSQSSKLIKELAKLLGATVSIVKDQQYEDFILGSLMESKKTGKNVSKEVILKKLRGK